MIIRKILLVLNVVSIIVALFSTIFVGWVDRILNISINVEIMFCVLIAVMALALGSSILYSQAAIRSSEKLSDEEKRVWRNWIHITGPIAATIYLWRSLDEKS